MYNCLSLRARKSLEKSLDSNTARELINLLSHIQNDIDRLERNKVDRTPIAPESDDQD